MNRFGTIPLATLLIGRGFAATTHAGRLPTRGRTRSPGATFLLLLGNLPFF